LDLTFLTNESGKTLLDRFKALRADDPGSIVAADMGVILGSAACGRSGEDRSPLRCLSRVVIEDRFFYCDSARG